MSFLLCKDCGHLKAVKCNSLERDFTCSECRLLQSRSEIQSSEAPISANEPDNNDTDNVDLASADSNQMSVLRTSAEDPDNDDHLSYDERSNSHQSDEDVDNEDHLSDDERSNSHHSDEDPDNDDHLSEDGRSNSDQSDEDPDNDDDLSEDEDSNSNHSDAERSDSSSNLSSLVVDYEQDIDNMINRLELPTLTMINAKTICKMLDDRECLDSWPTKQETLAACIFIACRKGSVVMTLNDICSVASNATPNGIVRAKEFIVTRLNLEMTFESVDWDDKYLRRICSELRMCGYGIRAFKETLKKCGEFDRSRGITTTPAAVLYIITQNLLRKGHTGQFKPNQLADISNVSGVSESTIKNSCKAIRLHLSQILPSWFANEGDVILLDKLLESL